MWEIHHNNHGNLYILGNFTNVTIVIGHMLGDTLNLVVGKVKLHYGYVHQSFSHVTQYG